MLSKQDILSADDLEFVDVEVPEWGGSVRVSMMSGSGRDEYEQSLFKFLPDGSAKPDLTNSRAKLLAVCLVDENNERLFTLKEVELLGKKNSKVIERLHAVADQLNAVSPESVKDLAKN